MRHLDLSDSQICSLLFLDPLLFHNKDYYASKIYEWLNHNWNGEDLPSPFNNDSMPLLTPKVPYQENGYDCGVFVCRYAYGLLKMRSHVFSQADIVDGCKELISANDLFKFDMKDISRFRTEFRSLIKNLSQMYSQSICPEPNSSGDASKKSAALTGKEKVDTKNKEEGAVEEKKKKVSYFHRRNM